jgi:hypothetical protein
MFWKNVSMECIDRNFHQPVLSICPGNQQNVPGSRGDTPKAPVSESRETTKCFEVMETTIECPVSESRKPTKCSRLQR